MGHQSLAGSKAQALESPLNRWSKQGPKNDVVISELQYLTVKDKCRKGDYFIQTIAIGRIFIKKECLKEQEGGWNYFLEAQNTAAQGSH